MRIKYLFLPVILGIFFFHTSERQEFGVISSDQPGTAVQQIQKKTGQISEDIDYGHFDFVPGDTILFEDEFLNEDVNEIPSMWQLYEGRTEIVKVDGKTVLGFLARSGIYPRMKKYNYLPSRFTIEFEFLNKEFSGKPVEEASASGPGRIGVQFYTENDNDRCTGVFREELTISNYGEMSLGDFAGAYENEVRKKENDLFNKWVRISIAVTETNVKAYVNSTRVLNASVKPGSHASSVQLNGQTQNWEGGNIIFVRNVRIAGGLRNPYKKGTTDIKSSYVARGIRFDYNKAVIRPESMGELNYILAMMKDHPEVKYEIGGHTDSDGDDRYNLDLSQQRAEAVKVKLTELGIQENRLTTKGYGEARPLADNTSPEGKANNRRVELTLLR